MLIASLVAALFQLCIFVEGNRTLYHCKTL